MFLAVLVDDNSSIIRRNCILPTFLFLGFFYHKVPSKLQAMTLHLLSLHHEILSWRGYSCALAPPTTMSISFVNKIKPASHLKYVVVQEILPSAIGPSKYYVITFGGQGSVKLIKFDYCFHWIIIDNVKLLSI